ncbi:Helicase associated domain protein [Streptomyces microflavus]|uniref:DEAD/DEAH box helicase n=1 Tax=Streptomyces microflavus TaxID=1919 RepID=UPI0038651CBE|nr:Helicase associated domain protein [Streptomyces microflavus]WST19505.1 Helicase associated domain protein [Streptomyces microflavus]
MAEAGAKHLRVHQREAYDAAVRALSRRPRATIISATGTGKTITAIRIAEHFAGQGNILVVVPSLNLVAQTAWHWHADSHIARTLAVCTLKEATVNRSGNRLTATTDPARIARTLAASFGPAVVFTTYQSLPAIVRAHRHHQLPPWEIVIIDEAHRSSGSSTKQWALIHHDHEIPAARRLYMTATPRVWKPADQTKLRRRTQQPDEPPEPLASMDDPSIYGPVVYNLGLADAIDRGILADYRIVAPVITDDDLREILNTNDITRRPNGLRLAALQVCLLHTMRTHRIRRVISFHSRIAYARQFSETLPRTVEAAASTTRIRRLWARALYSDQPPRLRARLLTEFEDTPLLRRRAGPADHVDGAVLSNVRILGEGVDVPDADAVLFADPKRSASDIIQALGRALRQPPGTGKIAVLIIPVYIGPRQNTEKAMNSSEFAILWEVLNGLRTHDAHYWRRLGGGHANFKRIIPRPPPPERAGEVASVTQLRTHLVDTGLWEIGWQAAVRFFERRRHLNVPSEYTDSTGYPLGLWLGQQRSLYAHGSLDPQRALALTSLNISWPHPENSFEAHLEQAITFAAHHGTLAVTHAPTPRERPLLHWLARQRESAADNNLHSDRINALNAVDPWWNPPWDVAWQHDYTRFTLPPHSAPPTRTPPSGHDAGTWLDHQLTQLHTLHPQQKRLLAQLAAQKPHVHPHAMLLLPDPAPRARAFSRGLAAARQYQQREGHLNVPIDHREDVHGDQVRLGQWLRKCRSDTAQMTAPQITALTALGIDLAPVFQPAPSAVDHTEDTTDDDDWWPGQDLSWTRPPPAALR